MRAKRSLCEHRSTNRAICAFLCGLCIFTGLIVVAFESFASSSSANERQNGAVQPGARAGPSASLGFAYPQLAKARQFLTALLAQQQLDWQAVSSRYSAALAEILQPESSSSTGNWHESQNSTSDLEAFLSDAFSLLAADQGVLQCQQDETLLAAWGSGTAAAQADSNTYQHHSATGGDSLSTNSKHYLLAANFHSSAAVLPNFIIQTLRLALLLPPGHLAVSVYESGSNDTSRMWLTLLHYLLLPLHTPHNITTAGGLSPHLGLPRIELLARLRNALIEPWLAQQKWQQMHPQTAQHRARHTAVAGSAELSYSPGSFTPHSIIFANDVFMCAEDVMRLLMHDVHIACGMDFYTAPWQQDGETAAATVAAAAAAAAAAGSMHGSAGSSKGFHVDDDEFFDPKTLQLIQDIEQSAVVESSVGTDVGGDAAAAGTGDLRFYDKWVARDISGHRLRNRRPFIKHTHSLQQLSAGHPVPMRCCWNGLAVMTAAPFLSHGVRFRSHQPGECAASECSLVCDDLHRLGYSHVVMDPAVRLAYELDQVNLLGGAASARAAAGAPSADINSSSSSSSRRDGLGPRLPWAEVAATSAQLVAQAQQQTAACQQQHYGNRIGSTCGVLVECCDLQPGHSYVDFMRDCHMVDIMAHNYTATSVQQGGPAAAEAA